MDSLEALREESSLEADSLCVGGQFRDQAAGVGMNSDPTSATYWLGEEGHLFNIQIPHPSVGMMMTPEWLVWD